MSNLISSLYSGASGLFTSQTAIQVTGNNIANVNTPGYSRQTANITSSTPLEQGNLQLGTGSTVSTVDRAGDSFITNQLNTQSATYSEYNASSTPLSDIEQAFSIGDSSLSSSISSFFDSWGALSSNPSGATERQQVLQTAGNLANNFQQINQQLTQTTDGINTTIESAIPSLNQQLQQIATLNSNILQTETASSSDANTLRDQRDLLVQKVSETTGATTYTDKQGMTCLQLPDGLPLVAGNVPSTFSTTQIAGLTQINLTCGQTSSSLSNNDFGGEFKGLLSVRDVTIPQFKDNTDQLAYTIATDVNTLHTTGIDQNGNAGTNLFNLTAPTDPTAPAWQGASASIKVGISAPKLIAAGKTSSTGDNSIALSMADLPDTASINGSTYNENYAQIASDAGLLVSSNEQKVTDSSQLMNNTQTNLNSISGVSTDQEMVNLIQYQAGYSAAAKYISTIKEMLTTLSQM